MCIYIYIDVGVSVCIYRYVVIHVLVYLSYVDSLHERKRYTATLTSVGSMLQEVQLVPTGCTEARGGGQRLPSSGAVGSCCQLRPDMCTESHQCSEHDEHELVL